MLDLIEGLHEGIGNVPVLALNRWDARWGLLDFGAPDGKHGNRRCALNY